MADKQYKELMASLFYLVNTTRLDILFIVEALSRYNLNPGLQH